MESWKIDAMYENYLEREYRERAVFSVKYGNSDFTEWTEKNCLSKPDWIIEHYDEIYW